MLNIIHAADLHLDSPFAGLTPEGAARRREEQRELLDRLADLAVERRADLVLLAGDLLDSGRVYRETVEALARTLGRIPARVFIAPGNHDPYGPGSPWAGLEWPGNVHIFSDARPQGVELPGLDCVVYGAAFTDERQETSPLAGFHAPVSDRLRLMVLHGNTEGAGYGPITPLDISASGLDYLALGHIHSCSGLQRSGSTFWAYPGCPEGRGFDELGDKGVLWVQADRNGVQAEFVPLCRRRYQILTVDLTGVRDPLEAVRSALPAREGEDIFRIRLVGESGLDSAGAARLEEELAPRCYGLEVQNHTRPPRDLWARTGEDTLTGLFLQEMAQRCAAAPEDETVQLAVRFGMAALENGEDFAL